MLEGLSWGKVKIFFCKKKASLKVRKHYFTIRAARDLNALPSEVINSKITKNFKNKLDNFWRKTGINYFETNN